MFISRWRAVVVAGFELLWNMDSTLRLIYGASAAVDSVGGFGCNRRDQSPLQMLFVDALHYRSVVGRACMVSSSSDRTHLLSPGLYSTGIYAVNRKDKDLVRMLRKSSW